MQDLTLLYAAIIEGKAAEAKSITAQALAEGSDPEQLIKTCMIPAMDEVGRRYEEYEYFVPELLISARAMKSALELVRPLLSARGAEPVGRVVIGTVPGDVHDIGKNIVASMLEGGGFEVIDLGVDVSAEKFISTIQETHANIIAMSALITTTMLGMETIIEALQAAGVRDRVKILVGGAPVTERYAKQIGADGYSDNAHGAVTLARKLVGVS